MKRSAPSSSDATSTPRQRKLRLLLHAVDGCVPFLSPDTLERHFPPSDDFWIGMAVRDTCVMPTFADKCDDSYNKEKNSKQGPSAGSKQERDPKKPRGYTFAPVVPDSWLLPYTRVTVPSFDWMQDNARQKKNKGQRPASGSTSTNQHILVWTPHGRQKLTPEAYSRAALGLKSHYTLSLYDMQEEPNNPKRLEKADARNEEWFQDVAKRRTEGDTLSDSSLWSPILIPSDSVSSLTMYHDSAKDVAGVALIGRWRPGLKSLLDDRLSEIPHAAMLSTYSLSEILDIATSDVVNIIGTNLPTEWAKDRMAFIVDLEVPSDKSKRVKKDIDDVTIELDENGCMDMSEKSFARDSNPLVPGCLCLACAGDRFSRAYIHHLICAKELLADILLFGHNLHHLLELIRKLSSAIDRKEFTNAISNQLGFAVLEDAKEQD